MEMLKDLTVVTYWTLLTLYFLSSPQILHMNTALRSVSSQRQKKQLGGNMSTLNKFGFRWNAITVSSKKTEYNVLITLEKWYERTL